MLNKIKTEYLMDLFKNILILSLSFFLFSCGGGGGGSSASPAAAVAATPTYSYDRLDADYTNKTWDTKTQMRRSNSSGVASAFGGFGDYPLTMTITEGSNYFDISISGDLNANSSTDDSLNYVFSLTDQSVNQDPLYNLDGDAVAVLFDTTFSNAVLLGVVLLPEGLSSVSNIKYTNVGFLDFFFNNGERDTFAFNYGSKTVSGDMPSSGSATYNIDAFLMFQAYKAGTGLYGTSSSADIVSEGAGSLNANFSTGSIDGELSFSRYFYYSEFRRAGAAPTNQILNVPSITMSLSNGNLNTNDFTGAATINSNGLVGSGVFQGSFFGNNANETSGTFLLGIDIDEDTSGADYWDIEGVFIGCKASGC